MMDGLHPEALLEKRGVHLEVFRRRRDESEGLALLDPRGWTQPAPARAWVVPEWVPVGVVTALYGDGGIGKTLAAQQLMTSTAVGAPWFGLDVLRGRTLGVFCEDDEDELQRRQEAINASLGLSMRDLGDMRLLSRLGHDNALVKFDGGAGALTDFHARLHAACLEWRPRLLVLDTAADLYPDNENERGKVRWFVQTALAGIAREARCAVVLLAHPSASGMASGQGTGGSTAWNNTVRSRLYLEREAAEGGLSDARTLSRKKANYAARDASLRLVWSEGVLLRQDVSDAGDGLSWPVIEATFDEIERAWSARRPWSNAKQTRSAGRYLPAWMAREHRVSEKRAAELIGQWLMHEYLAVETADSDAKLRGLRVLRRLAP